MNYQDENLRSKLTDDYVIGLMCTAAEKRFERLMLEDPILKQQVRHTQYRWNRVFAKLPAIDVPEQVWQRIAKRLFKDERLAPTSLSEESKQPLVAAVQKAKPKTNFNARNSWLSGWAIAASFATVFLAGWLWLNPASTLPNSDMVAVVNNAQQQPTWIISVDKSNRSLKVDTVQVAAISPQQDYELWMIKGNQKPVSMGILPKSGNKTMTYSPDQFSQIAANATLAVTVEAKGGSKTGQPTSAPLYLGKVLSVS